MEQEPKPMIKPSIALCGWARSGKDEAGKALVSKGWVRHCLGDIIKSQLDDFIKHHLGFSAFTEVQEEKSRIRGLLEQWADSNYENVSREYFTQMDRLQPVVNTRLCRLNEALEFKKRGGFIVWVERPGTPAATDWEAEVMGELWDNDLIDFRLNNRGSVEDLHNTTLWMVMTAVMPLVNGAQPMEKE